MSPEGKPKISHESSPDRVVPKEWDESPLNATGSGPIRFDSNEGFFENNFTAEQLNSIAQYGFERSRYLFDLADKGDPVTLQPDEIRTLADSYEEIAFQLGDGALFDVPPWERPSMRERVRRLLRTKKGGPQSA